MKDKKINTEGDEKADEQAKMGADMDKASRAERPACEMQDGSGKVDLCLAQPRQQDSSGAQVTAAYVQRAYGSVEPEEHTRVETRTRYAESLKTPFVTKRLTGTHEQPTVTPRV